MPQVAIDFMNQDHDKIYLLITQIQAQLTSTEKDSEASQITQMMQSLLQQCKEHFDHEESQMQAYHFPQLTEHQQEHQLILEITQEVLIAWQTSKDLLRLQLYMQQTLPTWLIGHVDSMDTEAALFISSSSKKKS
ncbi:MAG: hemerythrin [Thiomicrorhabdus sp.]|nr:MAG: hemerythrin [Thiomicrorhabdus sp.]